MTEMQAGPLSRPFRVDNLADGVEVSVVADAAEMRALAGNYGLTDISSLSGVYRVERRGKSVRVVGRVEARIVQTCVVTLEPFEALVEEPVEVRFSETAHPPTFEKGRDADVEALDAPDPIVDGRIDLGAVTAEFLALGLDSYPRKPGATFVADGDEADERPFAALAKLRPPEAT